MITTLLDVPEKIRPIIVAELERAWRKGTSTQAKNMEEAKKSVHEFTGYGLRLFWLGRHSKLNPQVIPAFEWMSKNLVDKDIKKTYFFNKPNEVLFQGYDHNQLAKSVVEKLWTIYQATPDMDFPAKKSILKKFFR